MNAPDQRFMRPPWVETDHGNAVNLDGYDEVRIDGPVPTSIGERWRVVAVMGNDIRRLADRGTREEAGKFLGLIKRGIGFGWGFIANERAAAERTARGETAH